MDKSLKDIINNWRVEVSLSFLLIFSLIHNARLIQDASERYYLDEGDWPRLTDEPYSAEEIENFAEKYMELLGKKLILTLMGIIMTLTMTS